MNNIPDDKSNKLWMETHWWIFIIAFFLYIIGSTLPYFIYCKFPWTAWSANLMVKGGETILVGGLIAFFSSYKTIIKGYRQELESLLFSTEYLEKRSDIDSVWDKISEIICRTKFPNIAKPLLNIIKANYLQSKDNIRCYHNYNSTIKIEWDSPDKKWIKIIDYTDFKLYADTNNDVNLIQGNIIKAEKEGDGTQNNIEIQCCDSNEHPVSASGIYNKDKQQIECTASIRLKGKTEYNIIKTVTRRYKLDIDNFIGFRAKYITNGISIKVSYPEDMKLTFTERGTLSDFKTNIINKNTCEYRYDGLILPRQGYTIFMSHL